MEQHLPVAFITGAARRIGATLTRTLHDKGYRVVIHYQQSADEAATLAAQLNSRKADSAVALQADLCQVEHLQDIAQRAQSAFGRIDVLINNASAFYPTPLGSITEHDWMRLVGSNVQGPLFLSQALIPSLKRHQGTIINMIDIHIDRPLPDHTVYCLAKSALASMTRSMANELAPSVRVNGIAPGAILWPERYLSEAEKQALIDSIPMGRLGNPEAIAHTAIYLIEATYVTGQIIYVDGGRSVKSNATA